LSIIFSLKVMRSTIFTSYRERRKCGFDPQYIKIQRQEEKMKSFSPLALFSELI